MRDPALFHIQPSIVQEVMAAVPLLKIRIVKTF